MRNIRLTVQYDGTDYNGWQIQPNGPSIQEILQDRIRKLTGKDAVIIGSGRTDAGVHALAQIASFRTESTLSTDTIVKALNANLPYDIRITEAAEASEDFHPRFDATGKVYFYIIANTYIVSPFLHRYVWRLPCKLDFKAMLSAAELLKGTHDFSSFRASGCGAKHPVRTVSGISIERTASIDFMMTRLSGDFVKVSIEANAFLRHMVRNIVGTLMEVGRGKISAGGLKEILSSKDRCLAGPTAPAKGLFLSNVIYPE